jgi:hypothetical protein
MLMKIQAVSEKVGNERMAMSEGKSLEIRRLRELRVEAAKGLQGIAQNEGISWDVIENKEANSSPAGMSGNIDENKWLITYERVCYRS